MVSIAVLLVPASVWVLILVAIHFTDSHVGKCTPIVSVQLLCIHLMCSRQGFFQANEEGSRFVFSITEVCTYICSVLARIFL